MCDLKFDDRNLYHYPQNEQYFKNITKMESDPNYRNKMKKMDTKEVCNTIREKHNKIVFHKVTNNKLVEAKAKAASIVNNKLLNEFAKELVMGPNKNVHGSGNNFYSTYNNNSHDLNSPSSGYSFGQKSNEKIPSKELGQLPNNSGAIFSSDSDYIRPYHNCDKLSNQNTYKPMAIREYVSSNHNAPYGFTFTENNNGNIYIPEVNIDVNSNHLCTCTTNGNYCY